MAWHSSWSEQVLPGSTPGGTPLQTRSNPAGFARADLAPHQKARASLRALWARECFCRTLRRSPLARSKGCWDGNCRPALSPAAVARPRRRPRSRRLSAPSETCNSTESHDMATLHTDVGLSESASIHFNADPTNAEPSLHIIVSVNQPSIHGATADWCQDLAQQIAPHFPVSTGTPVANVDDDSASQVPSTCRTLPSHKCSTWEP